MSIHDLTHNCSLQLEFTDSPSHSPANTSPPYLLLHRHGRGRGGQQDLVKLVGVSQLPLIEVERHGVGRLQTLDRVLTIDPALGAGAYLSPKDAQKSFDSHVGNSSTAHT